MPEFEQNLNSEYREIPQEIGKGEILAGYLLMGIHHSVNAIVTLRDFLGRVKEQIFESDSRIPK